MSKRLLTQDAHTASNLSFQSSASDIITEDLNTQLQNVGRRAFLQAIPPTDSSRHHPCKMRRQPQLMSPRSFARPLIPYKPSILNFPSPIPAPSDKKRMRAECSVDEPDEPSGDGDREQDGEGSDTVMQSASVIGANDLALSRPMKPLRRNRRTFGQTMSLPATVFESRVGEEAHPMFQAESQEEEDWSTAAFSEEPSKPHTLA
ncbi:hypothetical protein EDB86DRAFT_3069472 [Lactarius hatsudake]|nr:hypothetical protein EDB86DRAFT_3069472 [Lactarius hatsudake]